MNNAIFSVIIPTYNRAGLLKRCIESVLAQTFSDWEAIVVDNYSEDNTEEVVNSFNDPRIVYVKNHNYGVISVSRNKGIEISKGGWICFLDSDDIWLPNKLESMLPYFSDYDLIYHDLRYNIPSKKIFERGKTRFYQIKESSAAYVLQRGDPISPSCACVSRNTIGETRFSEDRTLIAVEDYDFFLQLVDKNIRIKYLRKELTLYDVSGCSQDGKGPERDLVLFEKWDNHLDDEERKEVKLQYYRRKADTLRSMGQFKDALSYYKKVLPSRILFKKFIALRGIVLCYFYRFF